MSFCFVFVSPSGVCIYTVRLWSHGLDIMFFSGLITWHGGYINGVFEELSLFLDISLAFVIDYLESVAMRIV